MSDFPVWVVQHSNHGRSGKYDIMKTVDVGDNGVLNAVRFDGRRHIVAAGEWEAVAEKGRSAVDDIRGAGELSSEGESTFEELTDDA